TTLLPSPLIQNFTPCRNAPLNLPPFRKRARGQCNRLLTDEMSHGLSLKNRLTASGIYFDTLTVIFLLITSRIVREITLQPAYELPVANIINDI
ncbi:MAG: hypothetical protein K2H98_04195, partial [Duncaniella sp.]|nr:hypothetical protein [Duncaniella sp.]